MRPLTHTGCSLSRSKNKNKQCASLPTQPKIRKNKQAFLTEIVQIQAESLCCLQPGYGECAVAVNDSDRAEKMTLLVV